MWQRRDPELNPRPGRLPRWATVLLIAAAVLIILVGICLGAANVVQG